MDTFVAWFEELFYSFVNFSGFFTRTLVTLDGKDYTILALFTLGGLTTYIFAAVAMWIIK